MRLASKGLDTESLRRFMKKFLSTIIAILLFNSNAFADSLICDFGGNSVDKFKKVDKKWCLGFKDEPMMDSCSIDFDDTLIIKTSTPKKTLNITWYINRYTGKAKKNIEYVTNDETLTDKYSGVCKLNQKKKF